jgi:6-phosphogluconolactonase
MNTPRPEFHTCATAAELAELLAGDVAALLNQGLGRKKHAGLVVSGGSTPRAFFRCLSRQDVDWPGVNITLADERWVDMDNEASNERLVRENLVRNRAKNTRFYGLKNNASTAVQGEKQCDARIAGLPRPFDVVILGMGNDGHTASFFPGAERLPEALDINTARNCIAITPPGAPLERMTLTLPVLLDTDRIILHITGRKKHFVLEKALADGPVEEMPIRCFLRQSRTPVHIYWAP